MAWAVILAAGAGSRFGGPKPLGRWQGGTLLSRAIAVAAAVCPDRVVVVTGGHADAVTAACVSVRTCHNADWQAGLGGSIAAGGRFAESQGATAVLLVPVDQPFIGSGNLRALLDRALAEGLCVLSGDGGVTGPPAAIPRELFARLENLTGHSGLKNSLTDYAIIEASGILRDADTPFELARLEQAAPRAE